MFEVTINGKKCNLASPDTLAEILRDHYPDYCVAALVNNRLHDLSKVIDGDCEIAVSYTHLTVQLLRLK